MKKLTLLSMDSDQDAMLRILRDLNMVHISHVQAPADTEVEAARTRLESIQRSLDGIPHPSDTPTPLGETEAPTVEEMVADIARLRRERLRWHEERSGLQRMRHANEPYGSFDPDLVRSLADEGISVRLFRAMAKDPVVLPEGAIRTELSRDGATAYFAVIAPGTWEVDAEEFPLPDKSLTTIAHEIEQVQDALAANRIALDAYGVYTPLLTRAAAAAQDEMRFHEVRAGMGASANVVYLQGFCPEDSVGEIRRAAAEHGWGLLEEAPGGEDQVPTLIHHPRWVRPIQVVLDFIGVLPGYTEVDISALFLVFFSIFFAMIVGDAGYGSIFLLLTVAGRKGLPKAPASLWRLMFIMSIGTIIWGLLNGNIFGILHLPAPLAGLKIQWLGNDDNMMGLCFLLGTIHLTIAHGWNVIRFINTPQALAQAGWIISTWYMYFWARTMVLGKPFPMFMHAVFVVGFVLIVVFMTPVRLLKSQWSNHVVLPLNLVSNFVDVVSYVRLFAVGMATFAVASAFNDMALGGGVDGLVSGLVAAFIIFFGHTLNIMLAMMGVLVHGVRLNTLEFSGHMGLTWSGSRFDPFAATSRKETS